MTTRRDFLKGGLGVAASVSLSSALARAASAQPASTPTRAPLDILILGGTGFIGPHLVRHALARGHRVTTFTRGRRTTELPAEVTRLQGDRNGKLQALEGKKWDAVIDDSATNPDWVQQSATLLKDAVGAYLFTSSTGVYYPYLTRGLSESDPVHYDAKDVTDGSETYGVAKANCERIVGQTFRDRGIVVRPTYIIGPGDTSDRFPYWPQRIMQGGEILAPGKRNDPMQVVDVRDLAEFMVKLVEDRQHGIYNAAGPRTTLTAQKFYESAVKALGMEGKAKLVFVDDYDFLVEHKIVEAIPWALLQQNDYGMMSIDNRKAIAAGLTFRPLDVTLRDTLAWWPTVPEARRAKPKFTITPEQEAKALADWKARKR